MKIKHKGQVFPTPSSSSSSSSALKLLPAAIFCLVSLLSIEDREVLAYLITRSVKMGADYGENPMKKSLRKGDFVAGVTAGGGHKSPVFDCDCFECYTSYWFRWDSSPNRELIHQAIEAFEDHLAKGEKLGKTCRGKKREKMGRRNGENLIVMSPGNEVLPDNSGVSVVGKETHMVDVSEKFMPAVELELTVGNDAAPATNHKGLAGKMLPDVMGIFNWRLWSMWSPK